MYKLKHGLLRSNTLFRVQSDHHAYNTRTANNLSLEPSITTTHGLKSVHRLLVTTYNRLPQSIKDCKNIALFKKLLKIYVPVV